MRLFHAILKSWKNGFSDVKENIQNLFFKDYHLIAKHHMYFLNWLRRKEIYIFHISQTLS